MNVKRVKAFFTDNQKPHLYFIVVSALTALFYLFAHVKPVMTFISGTVLWLKRFIAFLCSFVPFSVGEFLVVASALFCIAFVIKTIIDIVNSRSKFKLFYRRVLLALCAAMSVYFSLCLFLIASYFSENFQEQSGIYAKPASVEQLYKTASHFARKLNETASSVLRDEYGIFDEDLEKLFEMSDGLYDNVSNEFPFLFAPSPRPKGIAASKVMSYFGYTGFYFPFTGEANINVDAPDSFIPVTIAHEMAHQRGIASELEANFAAIITCVKSEVAAYEYSGWLLGYVCLSNALYKQDYAKFEELYFSLNDEVRADLDFNNAYWARFESPAAEIAETVYDSFLKVQGEELGVMSYGAVVDMLIVYFECY